VNCGWIVQICCQWCVILSRRVAVECGYFLLFVRLPFVNHVFEIWLWAVILRSRAVLIRLFITSTSARLCCIETTVYEEYACTVQQECNSWRLSGGNISCWFVFCHAQPLWRDNHYSFTDVTLQCLRAIDSSVKVSVLYRTKSHSSNVHQSLFVAVQHCTKDDSSRHLSIIQHMQSATHSLPPAVVYIFSH